MKQTFENFKGIKT